MQETARVVVIGGGVTGCAILYHLAKAGWSDVVLLERSELTAGSSWHAAGSLFGMTTPSNASVLQKYTQDLYPELEKESGQSCGFHRTGGLLLVRTPDQLTALQLAQSRAKRVGIEAEFISIAEAKRLAPILNTDGIEAVVFEPTRGFCDPASVTQAYAKAARDRGAKVHRHRPVTGLKLLPSGEWEVETPKGSIRAEFVVNAAGLWGREVAAMAGISLPLMPVEHHYMVTETIPEIAALDHEVPNIAEAGAGYYCRQEGKGLLLGAYESHCVHWAEDGTPLNFGHELLPDDVTRMEVNLARAVEAIPSLENAGIKRVINGPMIFSPDLGPLLGPYPGLPTYICAAGVMSGFNQGGGVGKVLAEWIIEGEPSIDVSFWDVARFGDWAGKSFTRARTKYFYEHRTDLYYPYQEYEAGRPIRTFPAYDREAAAGAVFGFSFGNEYPLWYAKDGEERRDQYGYGRGNWFEAVGRECRATREGVGLFEVSTFGKYEVTGPGAAKWLDGLLANRIPAVGRTLLCPMLSPKGRLVGDFTVTRLAENRFWLLGAGVMQRIHMRWFETRLPKDGSVRVENQSLRYAGLQIAGPNARTLLQRVAEGDVGANSFPFLSGRPMEIARCPEAVAVRVSFTGELGYELYVPAEYQRVLFDELMAAGKDLGLALAGSRALLSLRLEKSFPTWAAELGPDYTPMEPGLMRFVRLDKGDFVGRDALAGSRALLSLRLEKSFPTWAAELGPDYTPMEPGLMRFVRLDKGEFVGREALAAKSKDGPREKLSTLVVEADGVDCFGGEAVLRDGNYVGYVTSGGFGHTVGESIALAYIRTPAWEPGARYEVQLLGQNRKAVLSAKPRFDADGARMRS